jgi:hypothetical protein
MDIDTYRLHYVILSWTLWQKCHLIKLITVPNLHKKCQ